jgi:hypothetical protein
MALKEVIMNSCILFYIIFEVVAIIVWIENKYIKDAKEKNTMDDIFFWVTQGFAIVLFQLNKIIQLLGE